MTETQQSPTYVCECGQGAKWHFVQLELRDGNLSTGGFGSKRFAACSLHVSQALDFMDGAPMKVMRV